MASKKTIGAGIALDGEEQFRKAVKSINNDLNVLKSEMELVTSEFIDNKDSIEALTAKQKIFEKQIDSQKAKIEEYEKILKQTKSALQENKDVLPQYEKNLKKAQETLESTTAEYGKNSKEVKAAQAALKNAEADYKSLTTQIAKQEKAIADYNVSVNKAKTDINKMNKELADIEKQASGIDKVNDELEETAKEADKAEEKTSKLKNVLSDIKDAASTVGSGLASIGKIGGVAITGMTATATAAVTGFFSLAESTKETQTAMSKLDQSFTSAKFGADDAQYSVTQLYGILGDTDRSVEASSLLAKISKNEKDLQANTKILTGVFAEYGDSIPTEGLAEGMQATAAMGDVQGVLADALEWQGVNLDEYNEKLAELSTEEERAAYVQQTLTDLYGESADAYRENNAALIESNETQLSIEQSLASIGEAATPALNTLKGFGASLLEDVLPGMETFGVGLEGLFNGEDGATEQISTGVSDMLDSLISSATELLPTFGNVIGDVAPEIITSLTSGISENKDDLTTSAVEVVTELATGLTDCAPDIVDVGCDLIIGLVDGLTQPESFENLVGGTIECVGKIVSTLLGKIPDILSVGGQLIEGLWTGMTDKEGWLREKISGYFENLKQGIKDMFDIHSPSRWAKDEIMGNVMRGFGLGIEENEDDIKKQMAAFTATLTDDVEYDLNVNAISARIAAAEPPADILAVTHSQATGGTGDKFDRMLALLEIIAANSKKDILLDKKTLVGELTSDFNSELGNVYAMKERGN